MDDYRGAARRRPWVVIAFVVALAGLAGLPPGLAGLFAKVAIVRALLDGGAGWLAVVVALNAVVGLAYYVRAAMVPFQPADGLPAAEEGAGAPRHRAARRAVALPVAVGVVLAAVTLAALVVGVAPQLVLDAVTAPLQ